MRVNEEDSRTPEQIRAGLLHIYSVMEGCVATSLKREGVLPGGLKVRRRAPDWYDRLRKESARPAGDRQDGAGEFLDRVVELMQPVIRGYHSEGRRYVTLAIGCTGGR